MAKDNDDILEEFTGISGVGMSKARLLYNGGFESMKALKKAGITVVTSPAEIGSTMYEAIK